MREEMGIALGIQGGSAYYSSFLEGTSDLLTTHSIIPFFFNEESVVRMAAVSRQVPWAILRQDVKPPSYYQDYSILSSTACVHSPHATT